MRGEGLLAGVDAELSFCLGKVEVAIVIFIIWLGLEYFFPDWAAIVGFFSEPF